jgi:hypothetical protein
MHGEVVAGWRIHVEPFLQGADSGKAVVIPKAERRANVFELPASGVRSRPTPRSSMEARHGPIRLRSRSFRVDRCARAVERHIRVTKTIHTGTFFR